MRAGPSPMRTRNSGRPAWSQTAGRTGPETTPESTVPAFGSRPSRRTLDASAAVAVTAIVAPTASAAMTVPSDGAVSASPTRTGRPGSRSAGRTRTPGWYSPRSSVRPTSIVPSSWRSPGRTTVAPVRRRG